MNGIIEVSTSLNADQTRHLVFLISLPTNKGRGRDKYLFSGYPNQYESWSINRIILRDMYTYAWNQRCSRDSINMQISELSSRFSRPETHVHHKSNMTQCPVRIIIDPCHRGGRHAYLDTSRSFDVFGQHHRPGTRHQRCSRRQSLVDWMGWAQNPNLAS